MPRALVKILLLLLPSGVIAFLLWEFLSNESVISNPDFQYYSWVMFLSANILVLLLMALLFVISSSLRLAKLQKKNSNLENENDFLKAEIQVLKVDKKYLEDDLSQKDKRILERDMLIAYHTDLLAWANLESITSKTVQNFIFRIRNTTKYSHAGFWHFDPKTANLIPMAYYDAGFKQFVASSEFSLEDNPRLFHWLERANHICYNSKTSANCKKDFGEAFFDIMAKQQSFLAMPAHRGEELLGLLVLNHEDFDYTWDSAQILEAKFFSQTAVMLLVKHETKDLFASQRAERNAVLNLLDQADNAVAKFNLRKPLLINDFLLSDDNIFAQARIWHSNPSFDKLFAIKNKETFQGDEIIEKEIFSKLLANDFSPQTDNFTIKDQTFRRKIIADLNAGFFTGVWLHLTDITERQKLNLENQVFRKQIQNYSEWQKNANSEISMLSNQLKVAQQATLGEMTCRVSGDGTIETAQGFDSFVVGQKFVALFETDVNLRKLLKDVQVSFKPAVVKVNYNAQDKLLIIRNVFGKIQASLLPIPINSSDFYSKAVFEHLPIGVCIADSGAKLLYANKLASSFLELSNGKSQAILEIIKNKLSQNRSYDNLVKIGNKTLRIKASRSIDSFFLIIEEDSQAKDLAARFYYTLVQKLPFPLAVLHPKTGGIRYSNLLFQEKWPNLKSIDLHPENTKNQEIAIQNSSVHRLRMFPTEEGFVVIPAAVLSNAELELAWHSIWTWSQSQSSQGVISTEINQALELINKALQ
jgi:hypothetical protein